MRTPQRKIGNYAHLKPDPHITIEKYNQLKKKLEHLKKRQPSARVEVKRLAEMGDFSENAEYQLAKGRLRWLNQKVLDITDQLKLAIIIKYDKINLNVKIGSIVTIEIEKKIKKYQILGSTETDPSKNIISHNSLIGASLMNKKNGEVIKVKIANKDVEIKIVDIR